MLNYQSNLTCMKVEHPPYFRFEESHDSINDAIKFKSTHEALYNKIQGDYQYWDKVKYQKTADLSAEQIWKFVKISRFLQYDQIDFGQTKFRYMKNRQIEKDLHELDVMLNQRIGQVNPMESFVYQESLFEEAIASSQLEGANTTTEVARNLLEHQKSPKDHSEVMIMNNYLATIMTSQRRSEPLSVELILDIHQRMTQNTEASDSAGIFRDTPIYVQDTVSGDVIYSGLPADQLGHLIEQLCEFANNDDVFIHPIIKASIIHHTFAWIHPFTDGNGRTARTLFYWYMLKSGYDMMQYISISRSITIAKNQYYKTFQMVEQDDNDLTYFIKYSIKILRQDFQRLKDFIEKEEQAKQAIKALSYDLMESGLNKRPADFMANHIVRKKKYFTISIYSQKCKVSRQTASKDIKEIEQAMTLTVDDQYKERRYFVG